MAALRALKEDWREVVRLQAARQLEMRLDALLYQLQKVPLERPYSRRLARERLQLLALLLEGLNELRSGLELRAAELESALLALGLRSPKSSASGGGAKPMEKRANTCGILGNLHLKACEITEKPCKNRVK